MVLQKGRGLLHKIKGHFKHKSKPLFIFFYRQFTPGTGASDCHFFGRSRILLPTTDLQKSLWEHTKLFCALLSSNGADEFIFEWAADTGKRVPESKSSTAGPKSGSQSTTRRYWSSWAWDCVESTPFRSSFCTTTRNPTVTRCTPALSPLQVFPVNLQSVIWDWWAWQPLDSQWCPHNDSQRHHWHRNTCGGIYFGF